MLRFPGRQDGEGGHADARRHGDVHGPEDLDDELGAGARDPRTPHPPDQRLPHRHGDRQQWLLPAEGE